MVGIRSSSLSMWHQVHEVVHVSMAWRTISVALALLTAMLAVGCTRMVVPDNAAAQACVADAQSKRDRCEVTVSQNQQSCLQRARASAQTEYAQANAAYQTDYARWESERERERQQEQRNYQEWQREFASCRQQQEQAARADPLLNLEWAISHYCDDTPPTVGYAFYAPPEPRRPSLDDFVDTDGCERERRRSEDFCNSEFRAQVQAACGVTFD